MASPEPVIELSEVDVPRSDLAAAAPVIHNVRWTVARGDFWAVGGPPGAGKTDLLSTAAGLQRPLKGEQRLFGKDLRKMDEEELVSTRIRAAMVFAAGRLFPYLTVAENLMLPLAYHREWSKERTAEQVSQALEATGLSSIQNKRPAQVTRDLHQRIGLARALALSPEVLLIDNPLVGIGPRQVRWWLDFLSQVNSQSGESGHPTTIIVATDDFRPWSDTARQFAVLKEKHLEVIGGRDELQNTSEPAVRELLTA
jgi:ABC-type transporter Mla maintaining outer membrane lipid asymmetry ATPase subunit MlaF